MRRLLPAAAAVALLAGCVADPGASDPLPTSSATSAAVERPFTVTTTEAPSTYDPAAATTAADAVVALNVFSRLMVVHPDGAELKPDVASDCLYTSPTVYQCDLPEGLTFHNGHALTASDVKFSIERAYRLNIAGSSIELFDSLEKVSVIDDLTVAFELKYADSQFGYALATPAASIVDEELYDPDALRSNDAQAIGSGPYALVTSASDHLVFERNTSYQGALTGVIDVIRLDLAADSAAVETAVEDGTTDVVWRSLSPAALARISDDMAANDGATASGFTRVDLGNVRLHTIAFNPASSVRENASVRAAVAAALQPDRTLASIVLPGVVGGVDSFAVGGHADVPDLGGTRLRLTLGYSSVAPGERDLASLLRDRLEENAGMSVQLVPDSTDTDLILSDRAAWVNTAFGWLQPYVDDALPGSADKIRALLQSARETTDAATRDALLAEIQQQAAVDLTLIPVSVGPETLLLGPGVTLQGQPFGPAWQLGLWSLRD